MTRKAVTVAVDDLSIRSRIREAALELFAANGVEATSIRMVARAAGVSPGAVMHHYKAKNLLVEAVHQAFQDRLGDELSAEVFDGDRPDELTRHRREVWDRFLLQNPRYGDYVRRLFLEATPEGIAEFSQMMDGVQASLDALAKAGAIRPFPDPEVGIILYAGIALTPHYLRPLIEARLGVDLADPAVVARFRDAAVDLLTRPLFAEVENGHAGPPPPSSQNGKGTAKRRPSRTPPK